MPLFDGDKATVRVTEGALKADVATHLSGLLTVGLPGVAAARDAAGVLKRLGARTARVAFDADARRNHQVAGHLRRLVLRLREGGFAVELEVWSEGDGKGIDDLLHNGKTPRVLAGGDVDAEVADIMMSARRASLANRVAAPEGGNERRRRRRRRRRRFSSRRTTRTGSPGSTWPTTRAPTGDASSGGGKKSTAGPTAPIGPAPTRKSKAS